MSEEAGILPKRFSNQEIILAKYQLGHLGIYFLNYAYFDIQPSPNNYETPSMYQVYGARKYTTCTQQMKNTGFKNQWGFEVESVESK